MRTLENHEDPDEKPDNATFHQGLHFLLRHEQYLEKEMPFEPPHVISNNVPFWQTYTQTSPCSLETPNAAQSVA